MARNDFARYFVKNDKTKTYGGKNDNGGNTKQNTNIVKPRHLNASRKSN